MKRILILLIALALALAACGEAEEPAKTKYVKLQTYSQARAEAEKTEQSSEPEREESSSAPEPVAPEPSSQPLPESSSQPESPSLPESPSEPESSSTAPLEVADEDAKVPLAEGGSEEPGNIATTNWQEAEPTGYAKDFADALANLRAQYGLGPLKYYSEISTVAFTRLTETADLFSHIRPDGRACGTVMDDYGLAYMSYGENLARGVQDVYSAYQLWFDSPAHYANMVRPNYTGFCIVTGLIDGEQYWAALFVA